MKRLHLFNCSNDLALAQGSKEYIAPKSVVQMERDLASLPWWWAEEGDAVLLPQGTDKKATERFFAPYDRNIVFFTEDEEYDTLRSSAGCDFSPYPWGWSRASAERFRRFGVPDYLLPESRSIETMRTLSSREFAAEYIKELLSNEILRPYSSLLAGSKMRFIKQLDELKIEERTIFKSPWSSSGRGVFAANSLDEPSIREKLTGFIARQGGFIADKMYDKKLDFALEYSINNAGRADFLGYSVFVAGGNGYYGHNIVAPQSRLREFIISNGCPVKLLDSLIALHATLLSTKLKGKYQGVIGVDMLTAHNGGDYIVHPCIEINLRMNIGVLAKLVHRQIGENEVSLVPSGKVFGSCVKNSKLLIAPTKSLL